MESLEGKNKTKQNKTKKNPPLTPFSLVLVVKIQDSEYQNK